MHPDLSLHLHTPECTELINKLKECHTSNTFGKFVGSCNKIDLELNRCLKNERKQNQSKNLQAAVEKRELVQKRLLEKKTQQQQE